MSYASTGLIQASDYNTFANQINALWAVGTGQQGLGQYPIELVTPGVVVTAAQWDAIINTTTAIANQQGPSTLLTTIPNMPTQGNVGQTVAGTDADTLVAYLSMISSNITALESNVLYASSQTTDSPVSITSTQNWSTQAVYSFSISFDSGDAARYFFNAGGQFSFSMTQPNSTPLDSMYSLLCQQIGTLVFSSTASNPAEITVAGTPYTGFTQITDLQGAIPDSYQTQYGYYGLTTASVQVFKQRMDTGLYSDYLGSSIAMYVKTNGTQGNNGDNGSVITIDIVWSEIPPTLFVSAGTSIALTIKEPATTYITKTWGSPQVQYTATYS
jgi:hypothetical protein